ncbi:protein of unknown function [Flavobacterium glycines]|uniref:DUF4861 domain-containing protein n=1 Tax=Flavobacterium glycines TaxID=551990 RepID=A0A1B9DRB5_9FLAO|nr:DUF4861 family protein [Flavobacterium glycines]OCB72242.1 hypothetical protein FBGL_06160 [Flavobacterium glycines]GEL09705.1 hypothetical protein FGL01_04440 [Flavobacterium glycines]SDI96857.1 protein of unknown function [Flavobacterium glycines]
MKLSFMAALLFGGICFGQNNTDASLYMKADKISYLTDIGSESGDLYSTIGHHGPAVENEWMALRIYFSDKVAIDVYNKAKKGLELKAAHWYPTPEQQKEGWGADYYKVGATVGLGGVRLWDGEKVVPLNPVTNRLAHVGKTATTSYMEMISRGVPYKGKKVDIKVRVTVFSGKREAKVEAFSLNGEKVQFVTGVNYFKGFETKKGKNYIAVWGTHPEDVAAEVVGIGAAIKYNPKDYVKNTDDGTQYLLISKPAKYLTTEIVSASAKENEINNLEKLEAYMK